MRFVHLADLHIGIRVNGFSMLDDQIHILDQILGKIEEINPDGVLIAGDVYDKAQPSSQAVKLLDEFLQRMLRPDRRVLIIPGNHDSPERLSFGAGILSRQGLHIAGPYEGKLEIVTMRDEFGEADIALLPFLRPASVRPFAGGRDIESTADAVSFALSQSDFSTDKRRILLAHQFVVAGGQLPLRSESETAYAGGIEAIDISLFDAFDYVALGHLHKPQKMGKDHIRYAGSPLKYSFAESKPDKSIVQIDLLDEGEILITEHRLEPLHDMREIKGSFSDLIAEGARLLRADDPVRLDYLKVVLTDTEVLADPLPNLRRYYPNIMQMQLERARYDIAIEGQPQAEDLRSLSGGEMFAKFYQSREGRGLSDKERQILNRLKIKDFFVREEAER